METAATWLRWARAGTVATVATLLAVGAHVHAGGLAPSLPVLTFLILAMTAAAAALLGRPASTFRVVLLTVGGQAVAHQVLGSGFASSAAATGSPTSAMAPAMAPAMASGPTMDHGAHAVHGADSSSGLLAHVLVHLAPTDVRMMCAHLAAAVLVGLWLAAGERAVWSLLTHIWRSLDLPAALVRVTPARGLVTARQPITTTTVLARVLVGSVIRRGPPGHLLAS